MVGIYKITNKVNGKVYIGQSINIKGRWKEHRTRPFSSSARDYDSLLYRAIRKYGLNNFVFEVLEECAQEDLNDRERYYIKQFDANNNERGYNLTEGGSNAATTTKFSKAEIEEIYDLLINSELSEQEIANKYSVSQRTISGINLGEYHLREGYKYPLRQKKVKKQNFCIDCGKEIYPGSTRCGACASKASGLKRRLVERPTRDELKDLIRTTSFTQIAKTYGVSDNAVRKWCDNYNLPRKVADIKRISDNDWPKI